MATRVSVPRYRRPLSHIPLGLQKVEMHLIFFTANNALAVLGITLGSQDDLIFWAGIFKILFHSDKKIQDADGIKIDMPRI